MNYTPPPAYNTDGHQSPPPPVAGGVQLAYGSPSLQHHTTAGPVIYNTGASQALTYPKRVYENYHGRQSTGLGVTMILAGVLCIISNSVVLFMVGSDHISAVGYGIWSGFMFIVTGILGITAAKKKTTCKIVAFMVMCIISSVLCLILFIFSTTSAATARGGFCGYYLANTNHPYESSNTNYYSNLQYNTYNRNPASVCSKVVVLEAFLATLALIVTICTIWGSILCCKTVCCCANTGQVLVPVQYIPMQGNQQMTFYPMQQGCPQGSSSGIIIGSDIPSASGGSYNFPYNPQQYGQEPPIYNEHKVPL